LKGPGKPVPSNPVRDAILKSMRLHPFFRSHPAETSKGGTKYVSAFLGANGQVIAFDKAVTTKQPMWLRDETHLRILMDSLRVPFDGYPPEKGRNSNLDKLPEFKGKALLRAFPRTEADAMAIVEAIAQVPRAGMSG